MVITIDIKEDVITQMNNQLSAGELGTSSQTPSENDSNLIIGVPATNLAISGIQAGQQLTTTYNINSVTGNGNSYTEYGNFLTSGVMINRVTFTDLPKTSAIEFQISTIIQVE